MTATKEDDYGVEEIDDQKLHKDSEYDIEIDDEKPDVKFMPRVLAELQI